MAVSALSFPIPSAATFTEVVLKDGAHLTHASPFLIHNSQALPLAPEKYTHIRKNKRYPQQLASYKGTQMLIGASKRLHKRKPAS